VLLKRLKVNHHTNKLFVKILIKIRKKKAIGKAFAVLSDAQKRKHYDNYGPSSFESESNSQETYRSHRSHQHSQFNSYWNEDDFSADELFNVTIILLLFLF
jgi:DnaJ-class molecular chaperone